MKVRTKFTLWIAFISSFAALLFSSFVFQELVEEPYMLIKRELLDTGDAILKATDLHQEPPFNRENTDYPLERYYINLIQADETSLYQSELNKHLNIDLFPHDGFHFYKHDISPHSMWFDPLKEDDRDEVKGTTTKFLVLQTTKKMGENQLKLIIAKPLTMLSMELNDLLYELIVTIIIAVIIIILVSYLLAGRFLQPISHINSQIKEIRETSLNQRIPLGKSKDELHTLSSSLNSMFDRLQNSFEKQKEFISNASHEMKMPLTISIIGHEDLLARDLPEQVRTELIKQVMQLQRLNKLIRDLLDISQLEHREYISRTKINLPHLLEQVLSDFDDMLKAAKIQCRLDIERVSFFADKEKLTRLFINLIDNGIKYNLPVGGQIHIAAEKLKKEVKIVISNTSQDIPSQDLPHLFDQFYRVEKSRALQYGGTGLGLTIAKKIVELHGGNIEVKSQYGRTIFTTIIPLQ